METALKANFGLCPVSFSSQVTVSSQIQFFCSRLINDWISLVWRPNQDTFVFHHDWGWTNYVIYFKIFSKYFQEHSFIYLFSSPAHNILY